MVKAGSTGEIADRATAKLWRRRGLIMKTTAIPASHLPLAARFRLSARMADFVSLMKPRVMLLAVFTALVGLIIAPGTLDPLLASITALAIAAAAGAAGILNMRYDADIDAVMTRTAMRAIPRGTISRAEGLALSSAHREAALNTAHATIPTTVAAARTRHAA